MLSSVLGAVLLGVMHGALLGVVIGAVPGAESGNTAVSSIDTINFSFCKLNWSQTCVHFFHVSFVSL